MSVPKKEIDDLLEELIGAWNWDSLTNSEANNNDSFPMISKKRNSRMEESLNSSTDGNIGVQIIADDQLQMPTPTTTTYLTYSSLPITTTTSTISTPVLASSHHHDDAKFTPDIQSSVVISNQLLNEPQSLHVDSLPEEPLSTSDETLLVKKCNCSEEPFPNKRNKIGFKRKVVRKYVYEDYIEKYKYLKDLKHVDEDFEDVTVGFTKKQIAILEHQMRIYTQLSIQHYLQTFSHPKFWERAEQFKIDLHEFQKAVSRSTLNICNLQGAVDLLQRWKNELSEVNEENRKHIKFIEDGMFGIKKNRIRNIMRFPPKIMQVILTEEVFLYPEYVPKMAFRTDEQSNTYQEHSPSELM